MSDGMLRSGALVCAFLLTTALCGAQAQASVVDLFGYGVRGASMAGAVASHPRGHEAVYYNPASLAFERKPTFALGFQRGDFLLSLNGDSRDVQEIPALVLGFGMPLPLGGILERRLTLGLGFVLPQTSIIIASLPRPGTESFVLVENRAQTVSLQGGLGIRIFDSLSVGVGFIALAELRGAISVAPNDEGRLGSRVQDEVIADYALIAGLLARPTDWLSLAAVYHGESVANFSIPITADLGDQFTLPIPVLNLTGIAQFDPRQVVLEASVQPTEGLTVSAGLVWKQWSRFQSPIVYTAVPKDFPAQPDPGFEDTFVPRLGMEYVIEAGDWTITPRLGAAFEPTPVPEQTGDFNLLDNDRIISAMGVGLGWDTITLSLAGQWHLLPERTQTKDLDTLDPRIIEDNPGAPSITHGGHVLFWGVELGLEL